LQAILTYMHKIPRLIRWIGCLAILFFVWMFLMRSVAWWYFKPIGSSLFVPLKVLWMGFRYDAREVGILVLFLLLLGSLPFLHPFHSKTGRMVNKLILLIAITTSVLFFLFDFLHFRYLLQRLNASALSFLEDAKISGDMVWQTYPVVRIIIGIIIAVGLLFWISMKIYSRIEKKPFLGSSKKRIIWFTTTLFIAALGIFGRVGQYPLRWSDSFNLGNDFNANIALNPFQSFFSSLHSRGSTYDINKVKQYYPFMKNYLHINETSDSLLSFQRTNIAGKGFTDSSAGKSPNIVLVICESFSAYKSSMWGNPLNTTPYFNELCKKGIFFNNCFTPHIGTARGVWATVTGIPDVEMNKTASRNPRMVDQRTILNEFTGYEKLYFLGGSTSWANIRGLLTNNITGLKLFEEGNYQSKAIDVWGISDKNLFLEANKVLKTQTNSFFAIIQTAGNHRPYTIPGEDLVAFKKINLSLDSLKKYGFESNEELNAFRYTDFCFQQFMDAAKKEPYFNNTIFAFIGDHGIAGNAGDMFPAAWTEHGLTAYHVPLLFYGPKLLAEGKTITCAASQVDVLPTLAAMLNGKSYQNTTMGRNLLAQPGQDSCLSDNAFIMDHNNRTIGMVNGNWYYSKSLEGNREKLVWANFKQPATLKASDSLLVKYREHTNAFYETARYLLLNNKKTQ
jgi:phosphoglycerol transferase MdoB-like AlkP superfamily enzyme